MQGLGVDYTAGIHNHPLPTLGRLPVRESIWPEHAQHVFLEGMTAGGQKEEREAVWWAKHQMASHSPWSSLPPVSTCPPGQGPISWAA